MQHIVSCVLVAEAGKTFALKLTQARDQRSDERGRDTIAIRRHTAIQRGQVANWLTSLRGLASYTVPKVDVLVSGTFRSTPGVAPGTTTVASNGNALVANYNVTSTILQTQNIAPLESARSPGGEREARATGDPLAV